MNASLQRRLATGLNAVLVAALVVAIVGVGMDLAARHRWRRDLTVDHAETLLPETRAVLDRLAANQSKFQITAFTSQAKNAEAWQKDRLVKDFLRELEFASPWVTTRMVDFDADRHTAESLGVDRYGTIVVQGMDNRVDITDRELFKISGKLPDRNVEFLGEGAIAKGFEQILSNKNRVIYALQGHGEHEPYDRGLGELKTFSSLLDQQGWTVKTLDLLRPASGASGPPTVPEDAAAIVLLGPEAPLGTVEEDALRNYLIGGGAIAVFLDPGDAVPLFLEELGVQVPAGVVHDAVTIYPFEDRPLLRYQRHPITEGLQEENLATVVASAAPIVVEAREGVTSNPLLSTTPRGWIERGAESPSTYDPNVDGGPADVAVALQVRRPHPLGHAGSPTRVLVVGDADLTSDAVLADGPGDATFLVNGLRWLVGVEDRMSLVARPGHVRRVALSSDQLSAVRAIVVIALPILPLLVGLVVRFTRRAR